MIESEFGFNQVQVKRVSGHAVELHSRGPAIGYLAGCRRSGRSALVQDSIQSGLRCPTAVA